MLRMKELRNQKGISQQALADILHVTQQAIYKYEHGLAEPDIDTLITCAKYFETTVDYLIGATDDSRLLFEADVPVMNASERKVMEYVQKLSDRKQHLLAELIGDE